MPDTAAATETEATTTSDGASTTETGKDGTAFDAARAQRTIEQQREELRALKATSKELADAKARLKEIEDRDKSETEKMASRAQEATEKLSAAEQRAADLALQMGVERAARKLGFIDEDDAYRLIDRRAVVADEDGSPTNVEALLTALAKAKPHLVKAEGDQKTAAGAAPAATRSVPATPRATGAPSAADRAQRDIEGLRATGRYSV